jgi:type I restriction-modification system DNA methylase subunit
MKRKIQSISCDNSQRDLFESEGLFSSISIETNASNAEPQFVASELEAKRGPYAAFYKALRQLREEFHSIGRFDDANAKLDEMCKLLVLKVLDARHPPAHGKTRFCATYLKRLAKERHGSPDRIAAAIHDMFSEISKKFPEEMSAFGPRPGLNMSTEDDSFASALMPLLEALPVADSANGNLWAFDGLNEAFGHFIQDSFRNRKEDAQYMTPPEVVSLAVELAFIDIISDFKKHDRRDTILVADPTCGVGSFLAAAYRHACHVEGKDGRFLSERVLLFGQDKVERMARLASVNLKIFAHANAEIRLGNSIVPANSLDNLTEKVDLIITNPPFGAKFQIADVLKEASASQYPILMSLIRAKAIPKTLDSEYLLLDRELALLKPGGRLLMVVPDHVVSGNGFSEAFRLAVLRFADLIAVIDLPTETFAQAGTRTKTSVIYLRRHLKGNVFRKKTHVFMANSLDLGFRVISRAGASIKQIVGRCDLEIIRDVYRKFRENGSAPTSIACLCRSPSVAIVASDHLLNNSWTAGFYQTHRLEALQLLESARGKSFEIKSLPDLVDIDSEGTEHVLADEFNRCISVLHVREDGCIDIQAVEAYRPTTPGIRCRPNDILLSKINPRIPRICVVPQLDWELGCSTEFSVLRCRGNDLKPWELALLLRSAIVQAQIKTLTSGTSSSHNRVKKRDLSAILIPIPKRGSLAAEQLATLARQAESSTKQYYEAIGGIQKSQSSTEKLLSFNQNPPSGKFPT